MSKLATRCAACGTMFRVVQDQLRVSEGWVRCGRCDVVFNGLDELVDMASDAADQSPDTDEAAHGTADRPHDLPVDETPRAASLGEPSPPLARDSDESASSTPVATWRPEAPDHEADHADRMPRSIGVITPAASGARPTPWQPSEHSGPTDSALKPVIPAPELVAPVSTPGFMREADRATRWTSPAMRAALISGALMLTGVLAIQMTYHFRDAAAASSPIADRLLRSACARWACSIEAPRRIELVALEGSGLSRVAQHPDAVKLSINLRNRGTTDLMMPSVELSLTDEQGALIARRVLTPQDFRVDTARLRRGSEVPLEVMLNTGKRLAAGYTVELFYP